MPAPAISATHQRHMDAARRRVAHAAAMEHATDKAERRILEHAQERLAKVEADLAKLRPRALLHDGAGQRYTDAVKERARLVAIISQAEAALADAPEPAPDPAP